MGELARRVRAAWRILRHGIPAPAPAERVAVSAEDVDGLVVTAFHALGLSPSWPLQATSGELDALSNAAAFAHDVREQRWRRVERGEWPEGMV